MAMIFLGALIFPTLVQAISFTDIPEDHSLYHSLEYLKEKGVVEGYVVEDEEAEDGEEAEDDEEETRIFKPDQPINRVEALKMVFTAFQISEADFRDVDIELGFSDIESDAWYIPFLKKGFQDKIIKGYPDGTFKPGTQINLAESLKILMLGSSEMDPLYIDEVGLEGDSVLSVDPFVDVSIDDWYAIYAAKAKEWNINLGDDLGRLNPAELMTRGNFAEMVYRLMYIQEHEIESFELETDWPDYEIPEWGLTIKYPWDWEILKETTRTIVFKLDEDNGQISFERTYPNSGKVSVTIKEISEFPNAAEYFGFVKNNYAQNFPGYDLLFGEFEWNGYETLRISFEANFEEIMDWYVYLPSEKALIFYANIGTGPAQEKVRKEAIAIEHSFIYSEPEPEEITEQGHTVEEVLAAARANIFVDAKGEETLALFADKVLIETDDIGVGTGPVDYYYSGWADVTLKYERSFDVVLAIQEGRTSKF